VTADWFVLGEPTEMQLGLAHTISLVAKLHVLGKMKHFSTEDIPGARGVNAVEQAAKVIVGLGGSHRPLKPVAEGGFLQFSPRPGFELLPQLNVGPIRGGISRDYVDTRPALFPDVCTVTLDFRVVPGMTPESIERDLMRYLEQFQAEEPDVRYELEWKEVVPREPFVTAPDAHIVRSVAAQHERIFGAPPEVSQTLKFAASDASWMQAAGIGGVIYGPSGRYLSRPDERCEVEQLVQAAQVYACTIVDICS
jgi:acetylornithine deacetylase